MTNLSATGEEDESCDDGFNDRRASKNSSANDRTFVRARRNLLSKQDSDYSSSSSFETEKNLSSNVRSQSWIRKENRRHE